MDKLIVRRINLTLLLICAGVSFPLLWLCAWIYHGWGAIAGIMSLVCVCITGPMMIYLVLLVVAVFVSPRERRE